MAEQLPHLEGVLQDKLIEVADYQRPYAWEEKQLRDLWDDLDLLGADRHYAGTLVLQRTDTTRHTQSGQDLTVYEVVDGQQRLTTCLILLSQLRRKLNTYSGMDLEGVDDAVVDLGRLLRVNIDGVAQWRLNLGTDLKDFFEKSVLGDEIPDKAELVAGEQRLRAAAQFFHTQIDALADEADEAEVARRLVELRARVCYRLRFLVYDVDSSAEVGVLFETLNERGQSLSELEKVKNYLLYLSRQLEGGRGEELARAINGAWSDIFKNFAKLDISDDALLRAHWLATENPNSREWHGTATIKAKFPRAMYVPGSGRLVGDSLDLPQDASEKLFADVTTYVESLRKSSAFFRDIYAESAAYHGFDAAHRDRVRNLSGGLVRSGSVANFRPLLLAARLRYPTDGELYAKLVDLCERFSARVFVICAMRSSAGQSTLSSAAFALHGGADPAHIIDVITTKLLQLAPDDAVRASFAPAVDWYYRRSHKYVLYEYELAEVHSASDLPAFGHFGGTGGRTTEHVLPQKLARGSHWRKTFTAEQHSNLLNGIGNLVLTYDNSAYSNFDYARKRGKPGQEQPRCYFSTSALARERQIAHTYDAWTPETIERRRKAITDWALTRWRVEPPPETVAVDDDDDETVDVMEIQPGTS